MNQTSHQQTSNPSSGNNSGRGRNADTSLQAIFLSSFEAAETENNPKAKLYELFILIEKEFEVLYAENCALRSRLTATCEKVPNDSLITCLENAPLGQGATQSTPGTAAVDLDKSYTKKGQFGRQKWKTAFRGPSGRLVTSLKVGSVHPDTSKHRYVQHFRGHSDGIWHVTTANAGLCPLIASASADHTANVWLASDARCIVSYGGHTGSVNSVAFCGDRVTLDNAILLTTSGDRQAHIWKANIAHAISSISGQSHNQSENNESAVTSGTVVAGSGDVKEDDQQLTTATSSDHGRVIPAQMLQSPLLRLIGHSDVVVSGEWMFGGEQLVTASWDRTANVYDAESGKVVNTLSGHDQELTHCSTHSSQKLVVTSSKDFTFRLWDFREAIQSVAVFQGHNDAVTSGAFAGTHHIASASDDRTTKVWDLRNMRSPMSTVRLNSAVNAIAVCNKYDLIAIPQDGRHISVYDMQGMRLTQLPRASGKCHRRMVCCAAWLPDNAVNNLITCGFDKQIVGWKYQVPHRS